MARGLPILPLLLTAALLATAAAYLLPGLGPRWEFVMSLRATRLAGLVVVGVAIAVATVLFQTVTRNRILTPQIMGIDALSLFLQTLLTRHVPETLAFVGVGIVIAFYIGVGGRSFCAWTCPVNLVTDLAAWLRRRLNLGGGANLSRQTRYWILAMCLIVAAATGTIAWELINPVSMLHRGLFFGIGFAWVVILAVFLFDLFVVRHGWCSHLCPVGAFYSLIGRASILRVQLPAREACNNCLDCFAVCPEHQIIKAPLKGSKGAAPIILDSRCTNCGRCIDVCSKDVFAFGPRFVVPKTIPISVQPTVASSGQTAVEPK